MQVSLRLDISGALRKIRRARRLINGQQGKIYPNIGAILSESIKKNVEAGGRPKWKPRKRWYSHPILDFTGNMRDMAEYSAMYGQWHHSGDLHQLDIEAPFYGKFHQFGRWYGREWIIRKYILTNADERQKMLKEFKVVGDEK